MPFFFPDPVCFSFLGWPIRWYGLMYLLGIWFSLFYAKRHVAFFPEISQKDVEDFLPWLVCGILIGGRLGYVFFYAPETFIQMPLHVLYVWQGGMSFHGGLVGVIVAIFGYTARKKLPTGSFFDLMAMIAPIGLFFGRIGNFINQEAFGHITSVPWAIVFPNVDYHPRHPSQIYEALLEGLLLFLVLRLCRPFFAARSWILTSIFLFGYGAARWVAELYRVPDGVFMWAGMLFTQGQLLSLPMIVVGAFIFVLRLQRIR